MRIIRAGVCGLVVFGVLAHGAVEGWARAVLGTGAGLLFLAWAVHAYFAEEEKIVISPLLPPLAALSIVALGQLAFHGTASVYNTRLELQLLVTYLIILFVAVQAFRTLEDWRGFVWFVMVFGFLVAIFGILQHLTFNGKLYWFREMRYGGVPFGPYVNRNHFAGLMELVIPVALVPLVMGKVRRERWFLVGLFATLPMGALFLSASRGGIVSFGVELAALVLLMVLQRRAGMHALAGGMVLLVAVLMVSWLGVKQVLERFSSLQTLEVSVGKRASMRGDTWRIFLDHPWTGTGVGTLQTVYPRYETLYDGKIVNHTHNDYLEALAETGLLGGLSCAWFLGVLFLDSQRRLAESSRSFAAALHLSGFVGCTGFLVHSLVDFNLHIPANALLFFLMANLATSEIVRTAQPGAEPELPRVRMRKRGLTNAD
jgi:O-antigen ligase